MAVVWIEEAIVDNNCRIGGDYEHLDGRIDRRVKDVQFLQGKVQSLEDKVSELEEKNCSLEDCTSSLESTVRDLIASLSCVEGSICHCCDHLLSPEPHLDTKMEEVKEGEDEEESELEYETNEELEVDASESSYLTPIPGASPPTPSSSVPTRSPTPDYKGLD